MSEPRPPTLALLLIGNELLTGKVQDKNGPLVIATLRERGAELRELRVVPDDVATIAAALRELAERYDAVLTSGGVGPTHDDVTLEAVAQAFDDPLVERAELRTLIDAAFAHDEGERRVWQRMAWVPGSTELVIEEGMRWPVQRVRNAWILPGVPQIFERQFLGIAAHFEATPCRQVTLYVSVGEGAIAEPLRDADARFPAVSFGSYPVLGHADYRTRLTLESRDADGLEAARLWLRDAIGSEHVVHEARGTALDE